MTIADAPVRSADAPPPDQCLVCFVLGRVETHGCDGTLRWASAYRDAVAPADRGLEQRLEAFGGFCDCEILMNAFVPACASGDEDDWPAELPTCGGVRRGSTVPCRHWAAVSTWRR